MANDPLNDDPGIIDGCIRQDFAAWSAFLKKYSALISRSIGYRLRQYGIVLSSEDLDDIKQTLLASIWKERKLESVTNRQNISYWLAIVAGNAALEYARKTVYPVTRNTISIDDDTTGRDISKFLGSSKTSAVDELSSSEISEKADELIERMPVKERLIIKLNLFHDKKHGEIAAILGIPAGTVSNYIKRAKDKLRDGLKDYL